MRRANGGVDLAVRTLLEQNIDASTEGGWLYIDFPDGTQLTIMCEYGQSLDIDVSRPE